MNKKDFLNIIQKLSHNFLNSFITFLEVRYETWQLIYNNQNLIKELEIWQYIHNNLINNISKNENPLKYFLLNDFKNKYIRKIIDNIYEAKRNLEIKKIGTMLNQITFSVYNPKTHIL